MQNTELFLIAARRKYRFPSVRGDLTVEQLFDLPLTSKSGFDLDTVARGVNTELKAVTEESFVNVNRTTGRTDIENRLDIVKFVIADRVAENDRAKQQLERRQKREKILDAIARKDDEEINNATKEDLLRQLEELDG